jgi:hypothetical protein
MNECAHKHTGSYSPKGVYLAVYCQDCGERLAISEEGVRLLAECPEYAPAKTNWDQACLNCGFRYWDHVHKFGHTLSAERG